MKLTQYLTLSLICILFCFSCNIEPFEGEVPGASGPSTGPGVFQVDFDGQTFIADNISATIVSGIINITGMKSSTGEGVIITLVGNSVGTYQLGVLKNSIDIDAAAYNTNLDGTGDTWISTTDFMTAQGEITITEINEANQTISGTFFFTGHNVSMASKTFENGSFTNVPYTTDVLPGSGSNTFFAKVDGVEFEEDGVQGFAIESPGLPSTIGISATKNNLETIGLNFDLDIEPGEYPFSTFSAPMGQYSPSRTESAVSESGTVIITIHDKVNKRIVGTFEFIASPLFGSNVEYEITEGSFDITYL